MKQNNLKEKYGITDEELKRAVNQIKLGNIACSGAALSALCDLLANGDIEGNAQSQPVIIFSGEEHKRFFIENLNKVRVKDSWHKALIYTLGITDDCRRHFNEIYDLESDRINFSSLHSGWVTGMDVRAMRLAFNLFTDNILEEGKEKLYTATYLFDYGCVQYFLQAIALRFE